MKNFELPLNDGNPINIKAFELHLQTSPVELREKQVAVDKYIPKNKYIEHIQYNDACFEEGCVNFCLVHSTNETSTIHFFGTIKETDIRSSIKVRADNLRHFDIMSERVKFILIKSKTILKSYYDSGKVRNIQHHLLSFLHDIK